MNKEALAYAQDVRSPELREDAREREQHYKYMEFMRSIINKSGLILKNQMIDLLRKNFPALDKDSELVEELIDEGEYNFLFGLSNDNILISYNYYEQLTGDQFNDQVNRNAPRNKIERTLGEALTQNDKRRLRVLALLANLGKKSSNFVFCNYPWDAMFTSQIIREGSEKPEWFLYQIAYFDPKETMTQSLLIKQGFDIDVKDRKYIRRYAIVENDEMANRIPYCGFDTIVKIDEKWKAVLVERRADPWNI